MSPIFCAYTDGGPDHRNTYLSVQISLMSLFMDLDLDMLFAACTAPHNSYRNPVECVMSLLNIGLQAVGMMRQKIPEEFERIVHGCNSSAASKNPGLEGPSPIVCSPLCACWQRYPVDSQRRTNSGANPVHWRGDWGSLGVYSRDWHDGRGDRYSRRRIWNHIKSPRYSWHTAVCNSTIFLYQEVWDGRLQDMQTTETSSWCIWEAQVIPRFSEETS